MFSILNDDDSILFVLDEVGLGFFNILINTFIYKGTKRLRRYAYSKIGEPAILKSSKLLKCNITCTATISPNCVEAL